MKDKIRVKRSIHIPQRRVIEMGLHERTDLIDWAIVDYIRDWCSYPRRHSLVREGVEYTRISYSYLREAMPLLKIKDKNAISRRIQKLQALELIKTYHAPENTLYVALTLNEKKGDGLKKERKEPETVEVEEKVEQENIEPNIEPEPPPEVEEKVEQEQKFYTPDSPIDDSLSYATVVRRIINYWNARAKPPLSAADENFRTYINMAYFIKRKYYTEQDYYTAIDLYMYLFRAGKIRRKTLSDVALMIRSLLPK